MILTVLVALILRHIYFLISGMFLYVYSSFYKTHFRDYIVRKSKYGLLYHQKLFKVPKVNRIKGMYSLFTRRQYPVCLPAMRRTSISTLCGKLPQTADMYCCWNGNLG